MVLRNFLKHKTLSSLIRAERENARERRTACNIIFYTRLCGHKNCTKSSFRVIFCFRKFVFEKRGEKKNCKKSIKRCKMHSAAKKPIMFLVLRLKFHANDSALHCICWRFILLRLFFTNRKL